MAKQAVHDRVQKYPVDQKRILLEQIHQAVRMDIEDPSVSPETRILRRYLRFQRRERKIQVAHTQIQFVPGIVHDLQAYIFKPQIQLCFMIWYEPLRHPLPLVSLETVPVRNPGYRKMLPSVVLQKADNIRSVPVNCHVMAHLQRLPVPELFVTQILHDLQRIRS